nr:MAG TPA: hypothetical protein [Bacteriophage sp.]
MRTSRFSSLHYRILLQFRKQGRNCMGYLSFTQ